MRNTSVRNSEGSNISRARFAIGATPEFRVLVAMAALVMLFTIGEQAIYEYAAQNLTEMAPAPAIARPEGSDELELVGQPMAVNESSPPIPLGTVTQSWDNSSLNPSSVASRYPPGLKGREFAVVRPYGLFIFDADSPAYLHVGDREASSVFTVKFRGELLPPSPGYFVERTERRLVTRHQVLSSREPLLPAGTMTTTYEFGPYRNKITAAFAPASAEFPEAFEVTWVTRTELEFWEDGGIRRSLNATSVEAWTANATRITLSSTFRESIGLDFLDARTQVRSIEIGRLAFDQDTRGTVLITFAAGNLTIDPSVVQGGVASTATRYSTQRKTFFDGERHWVFWAAGADSLGYASSLEGRDGTWSVHAPLNLPGVSGTSGFTVTNFGRTVAIAWHQVSESNQLVKMISGVVQPNRITWDPSQTLVQFVNPAIVSINAAFTRQGLLAVTYGTSSDRLWLVWYECTGTGSSPCFSGTVSTPASIMWVMTPPIWAIPVPFLGTDGRVGIVVVYKAYPGTAPFQVWFASVGPYASDHCEVQLGGGASTGVNYEDIFAATASGNHVVVFWMSTDVNPAYRILRNSIDRDCALAQPLGQEFTMWSGSEAPRYLGAGTEADGRTVYLVLTAVSGAYRHIHVVRTDPVNFHTPAEVPPWLSSEGDPDYVTVAASSTRFLPILYTYLTNLKFATYPLPADTFAHSARNPWTQSTGARLDTELGGTVNPSTGVLSFAMPLVGMTSRAGNDLPLSLLYRQPAVFYRSGSQDLTYAYAEPKRLDPSSPWTYGFFEQGAYLDLPWIDVDNNVLHLQGGLSYAIAWNGPGIPRWFDNTAGVRFSLVYYQVGAVFLFDLRMPSGAEYHFWEDGSFSSLQFPGTDNAITAGYVNGKLSSLTDNVGRSASISMDASDRITQITYGAQKYTVTPGTGVITLTDVMGRRTLLSVSNYLLTKVEFPTGGKVEYTFGSYGAGGQIWQGADTYGLPVLQRTTYNQTAAGLAVRTTTYTYHVQGGDVALAELKLYDGSTSGAYRGAHEYRYRPYSNSLSVRSIQPSSMTLAPTGADESRWTPVGCVANWDCVARADNANVAATVPNSPGDSYQLQSPGESGINGASTTITSLTLTAQAILNVDPGGPEYAYLALRLKIGETNFFGPLCTVTGLPTICSTPWTTNPATQEPWSLRDIDRLRVGMYYAFALQPYEMSVNQLYLTVTLGSPQVGVEAHWYSQDDQPHFVETFRGDAASPSGTSLDFVDDWGNRIYSRAPSGAETFGSYANTNHQNHFFAPGLLTKVKDGRLLVENFDLYAHGFGIVSGAPSLATVETLFNRYMPSLQMTGLGMIERKFERPTIAGSLVEANLRVSAVSGEKDFLVTDGSTGVRVGVRFGSGGTFQYRNNAGLWIPCSEPYGVEAWYRISIVMSSGNPGTYRTYRDGVEICGASEKDMSSGEALGGVRLATSSSALTVWMDDLQATGGITFKIFGLADGHRAYLRGATGMLIDQEKQVGSSGVAELSFRPDSFLHESGVNLVTIGSGDSTLEYVSPHKGFYGGDEYVYTPPRTVGDRLAKTRSGFRYWNPTGVVVNDNPEPAGSVGVWGWNGYQPMLGSGVHENRMATSPSEVVSHGWDTGSPTFQMVTGDDFLVQFVYFRSNYAGVGTQTPNEVALEVRSLSDSVQWKMAFWGTDSAAHPAGETVGMGAIPPVVEGWIQLLVKASDLQIAGTTGSPENIGGILFKTVGGETLFDVTAKADSAVGQLKITDLPTGTARLRFAGNDTLIQETTVGALETGAAVFDLYGNGVANLRAFPVSLKLELLDGTGATYYTSAPLGVFGGDVYKYLGERGFYDSGGTAWPGSDLHASLIGLRVSPEDCLDASLCYDMETTGPSSQIAVQTGTVDTILADLSGGNNPGRVGGTWVSRDGDAVSGNAMQFSASIAHYLIANPVRMWPSDEVTISAWFKTSDTGQLKAIASYATGTGGADNELALTIDAGAIPSISFYRRTSLTSPPQTVADGKWHHVAATWRKIDGETRIYVDGAVTCCAPSLAVGSAIPGGGSFVLGQEQDSVGGGFDAGQAFVGFMDQVAIFGRVLTASEIAGLFRSRLPGVRSTFAKYDNTGMITQVKVPYEGRTLTVDATYDGWTNLASLSDMKSIGNGNVTIFRYSDFYGRAYPTMMIRPLGDGREAYYSYDRLSGRPLASLATDCVYSRTSYDLLGRPTGSVTFDRDLSLSVYTDLEMPETLDGSGESGLKDVACAGTADSRNGNDGTITGAVEVDGIQGKARDFDGVDDKVVMADSASLSFTSSFTLAAWIRPDAIGTTRPIVSKWTPSVGYSLYVSGTDQKLRAEIGNAPAFAGSLALSTGVWTHVALVFNDAANTVQFYVNGATDGSAQSYTGTPGDSAVPFQIGFDSGLGAFDGILDEVRAFSRALPTSEVLDLYQLKFKIAGRSARAYDDMTAHGSSWLGYQFPSVTDYDSASVPRKLFLDMETKRITVGTTTYLEDLSGHGNHIRNAGAVEKLPVDCKVGKCYEFVSSESDYMEVPSTSSLSAERGLTIAAWIWISTTSPTVNPIVAKGQNGVDYQYYTDVHKIGSSYKFSVKLKSASGGTVTVDSSIVITRGAWQHVAFTWDGTTLRLYVNSALAGSGTLKGQPLRTTTLPLRIGHYLGTTTYLSGRLDEIHVVDRALTATEIGSLYLGPTSEKGHITKTYFDGLGRSIRTVLTDFFSTRVTSRTDSAWNDDTSKLFPPATGTEPNKVYSLASDMLGRRLAIVAPLDGAIGTGAYHDRVWASHPESLVYFDMGSQTPDGRIWDRSLNGNHGSLTGGRAADGRFYRARQFDSAGGPDFVTVGDIADFEGTAPFTVSAWFRRDLDHFYWPRILSKEQLLEGQNQQREGWLLHVHAMGSGSANKIGFDRFVDNSGTFLTSTTVTAIGVWYHAAVSYDGTSLRMYVNGSLEASATTTQSLVGHEWPLRIGADSQEGFAEFNGAVDEVFVIARALSAAGVADLSAGGGPGFESIDPFGRGTLSAMDADGRSSSTAVWNLNSGAYGNRSFAGIRAGGVFRDDANGMRTTTYRNLLGIPVFTVFPDGTSARIQYDDNLRAAKQTDAAGRERTVTYTVLGQVDVESVFEGGIEKIRIDYTYDNSDNLYTMQQLTGSPVVQESLVTRTYDVRHRLKSEATTVGVSEFTGAASYAYEDPSDRLMTVSYPPSGSTSATYKYDSLGRLKQVDYAGSKYAEMAYDSAGRLQSIHFFEGGLDINLWETYGYDARDRVTQVKVYKSSTTHMQLDYTYNAASEVTSVADYMNTPGGTRTHAYGYDGNGFLTAGSGPFGPGEATEAFALTYDPAGNILSKTEAGSSTDYDYGPWNRLDSLSGGMSRTYTYTAAGSALTRSDGWTYGYDAAERMTSATNGVVHTYTYDGLGRRIKAVEAGTTTYTLYSGDSIVFKRTGATDTHFVYADGMVLLRKASSEADVRFYHHDLTGNVRLVTYDAAGLQIDMKLRYRPFGDQVVLAGTTDPTFRFAGQTWDAATGLYHMGARYQDPQIGRFQARDPIGPGYEYGANNPLSFFDPTGLVAENVINGRAYTYTGGRWTPVYEPPPDYWLAMDLLMTAVGFVPVAGDIASTAYFLARDYQDCVSIGCDTTNIGLDLAGLAPFLPNLGRGLKAFRILTGVAGGAVLPFVGGAVRHANDIPLGGFGRLNPFDIRFSHRSVSLDFGSASPSRGIFELRDALLKKSVRPVDIPEIIVFERFGKTWVGEGHGRLVAFQMAGLSEMPVKRVRMTATFFNDFRPLSDGAAIIVGNEYVWYSMSRLLRRL